MPIYEYRCQSCDHELEVMQKLSDPELSDCPTCGKPALKKLISVVGFRLKGGGWYETDFKGGSTQKNLAKEDAAPKESKPAAACESTGSCAACPAPATTP
ncbi:MAG: zinc ribbon domain-containing protein [Candidatus Competibacter denitrificans]|jgi:putative FmdB family regulatory protein|uniref:Regulatory protein, FmdB family n=1 Tax=Candidatus Competibacter denitrificans Run_A_D11 TaxID=1400863 RepID=W6M392_9GAMM|nr:zinc ribbon domain-containing protein [Candidatus Competibacter denitrificans]CDI00969.1 Regulatory protein, FmdB family [Candidatus Competibacter denitrificans Run_A_D11]HAS86736.1 zinc ribbon domain-containing protein [Candidatus Competibacteraceae bacterium]HRC70059.1 zinc ribbon domain-containing protein [Candidatus Competibacter denitrificans]